MARGGAERGLHALEVLAEVARGAVAVLAALSGKPASPCDAFLSGAAGLLNGAKAALGDKAAGAIVAGGGGGGTVGVHTAVRCLDADTTVAEANGAVGAPAVISAETREEAVSILADGQGVAVFVVEALRVRCAGAIKAGCAGGTRVVLAVEIHAIVVSADQRGEAVPVRTAAKLDTRAAHASFGLRAVLVSRAAGIGDGGALVQRGVTALLWRTVEVVAAERRALAQSVDAARGFRTVPVGGARQRGKTLSAHAALARGALFG